MAIESVCSGCSKRLRVDDQFVGRQARCPVCGTVYTVGGTLTTNPVPSDSTLSGSEPSSVAGASDPYSSAPYSSDPRNVQGVNPLAAPIDGTFWTKTPDGNIYGPADHSSIRRWIQEGRLNTASFVRIGEQGDWQPAASLFPELQHNAYSGNPSVAPYQTPSSTQNPLYPGMQPDRSVLVLVMGILSWVLCLFCLTGAICAVIGVIFGHVDLKSMRAGKMDPSGKTMTQVGYYLSLVNLILTVIVCGIYAIFIIIAIITGN